MSAGHTAAAGRTALVTGAGNGLGRAISLALAAAGARVVLVGRTRSTLEQTSASLPPDAPGGRVAPADVSEPAEVDRLAAELVDEEISVLVNNAGVGGPVSPLVHVKPDEWDAVLAANVRSVYLMCRAGTSRTTRTSPRRRTRTAPRGADRPGADELDVVEPCRPS